MLRLAALAVLLGLIVYVIRALFRSERRFGAILAIALLAAYVTWPPDALVLDGECRPDDLIHQASAAIHGGRFWRQQLEAIRSELVSAQPPRLDWLRLCEHAARVRSEQGGTG